MDFPTLPPILLEDSSSLLGVDRTLMATAPSMLAPTTPEVVPQVTPLTLSSPSNFLAPVSAAVSDNLANQGDSLLSVPLLVNQEAANFSFWLYRTCHAKLSTTHACKACTIGL